MPFLLTLVVIVAVGVCDARAQDLFELEVFDYDTTPAGEYEAEFHTNGLSGGSTPTASVASGHRPVHMSIEVTRGWTDRLEAAVFLQTAPFGPAGSARFAGGHLRTKLRIARMERLPVRLALGAEYAFNVAAFSHEHQTAELRPIIDYHQGRLVLIANPSLELVTRGAEDGLDPAFNMSARAAWRLVPRVAVFADYFSRSAHMRHLRPEPEAHRFVFSGFELEVTPGLEWSLSAGHCVTQHEPWLIKSVVGFRF